MSLRLCSNQGYVVSANAPKSPGVPARSFATPPAPRFVSSPLGRVAPTRQDPARQIKLGVVIGWGWALFAGIAGFVMLFEGEVDAGICVILSSLVALPPANAYVARHWHVTLSGWLRFVVIAVLMMMAVGFVLSQRSLQSIHNAIAAGGVKEHLVAKNRPAVARDASLRAPPESSREA